MPVLVEMIVGDLEAKVRLKRNNEVSFLFCRSKGQSRYQMRTECMTKRQAAR